MRVATLLSISFALVATAARAQTPANFTATAVSPTTVNLAWDDLTSELSYQVWRAPTATMAWGQIGSPAQNATSFVDSAAPNEGTSYEYRVFGICGSPPGMCGTPAQTSAATELIAPTSITVTISNSGQTAPTSVSVGWTDNSSAETAYEVERKYHDWETGWTSIDATASNPQLDTKATGALDFARYTYRVRAASASAASDWLESDGSHFSTWGDTTGDWCSSLAEGVDRRFAQGDSPPNCTPNWTAQEIADDATLVTMGSALTTVNSSEDPEDWGIPTHNDGDCRTWYWDLDTSHESSGSMIGMIDGLESNEPARFVYEARFDLVANRLLANPIFDASWLVTTNTSHQAVESFFNADTSDPDCDGMICEWHEIAESLEEDDDWQGVWLRDLINARADDEDAFLNKVYYLPLSRPGTTSFHPTAVLANQSNPEYREFRVDEAAAAVAVADWDFILLNNKFFQYWDAGPQEPSEHWIGSANASNVTDLNELYDTLWTAEPSNYDYTDYVVGWNALAADLATADVPFAVVAQPGVWPRTNSQLDVNGATESKYDDPATGGTNEAALIRSAVYQADLVMLERRAYQMSGQVQTNPDSAFLDLAARIRSYGPEVFVIAPVTADCD